MYPPSSIHYIYLYIHQMTSFVDFIYPSIFYSLHLSTNLLYITSIHPSSIHFVYPSILYPIHLSIHLLSITSIHPSSIHFISASIFYSFHLSIHLLFISSIHASIVSIYPSILPSIYLYQHNTYQYLFIHLVWSINCMYNHMHWEPVILHAGHCPMNLVNFW